MLMLLVVKPANYVIETELLIRAVVLGRLITAEITIMAS